MAFSSSDSAYLCSHETRPRSHPRTLCTPHLFHPRRILSSPAGLPSQRKLFSLHTAGRRCANCGRKDSHSLHTHFNCPPLQTSLHPNAVAIAVAFAVAISSSCSNLGQPQTPIRWFAPICTSTPAQNARYICFLASWYTAQVPRDPTPLILTIARRQFVPRNRRDEPAGHTRARHSDKVSTDGRRDYLVPAQPKPASAAYQRVHHTLPPRAKPEYIGNPSPSESDPAAQSTLPACLPTYLPTTSALHALLCPLCLLLLFSACLALSFPGHFIRDGGGNQQLAIVPSELSTNITFFFLRRCPTLATRSKSPFRFYSLRALEPQLHCCTVVALVPPGLVLSAPPIVRKTRTLRASIPVTPTLVHRCTNRHEARVPNGVCVYRISPVPITITLPARPIKAIWVQSVVEEGEPRKKEAHKVAARRPGDRPPKS